MLLLLQHHPSGFPVSTTAVWPISVCRSPAFATQEHARTALILHLWTEFMSSRRLILRPLEGFRDLLNCIHSSKPTPTDLDAASHNFLSGRFSVMFRSRRLSPCSQRTTTSMFDRTCLAGFATTWPRLRLHTSSPRSNDDTHFDRYLRRSSA